ncbi:MAG: hypothetical protein KatS3mg087_1216 [Patescibacteria group bacterium]|nr:MAG: hypothetical protein KatS3mg087_1216 [Patescibacteria group bacterium]
MSTNNQKQLKLIDDNEDYPESIKQTAKAGVTAAKLLYNGLRSHKIRHKKPDLLKWSQEFISFFKEQEPEAIAVLLDLLRVVLQQHGIQIRAASILP